MTGICIPTSADIRIEVAGRRVAVVQHSAYGAGRILAREGDRVRIRFSSGSERVFSLAAAVPNGLLSLRQESGGNAAKAD